MEEVLVALNSKELKKRVESKESGGDGLFVRGRTDYRNNNGGHNNSTSQSRSRSIFKKRCHVCNSDKQFKRDCLEWKKKKSDGNGFKSHTNHVAPDDSSDGYDSADVLIVSTHEDKEKWVMDSGCSYHMTSVKSFFKDLKMQDLGSVKLGDDRPCRVLSSGSVALKMNNGSTIVLQDVRYIPDLKRSLLSLATLEKTGYHVSLKDGKAKVSKGYLVVLYGSRTGNNTYLLDGNVIDYGSVSMVSEEGSDMAMLWHKRLGHIIGQGLVELSNQGLINKVKNCDISFVKTV